MKNNVILPKDKFFNDIEKSHYALTFGDVKLKTGHSEVPPNEVSLESKFSRNISLKIPIVSAAMDRVTEHKMAIEMAKLGGLGVIHRNLTPREQAHEVAKVKFYLNGLIEKPICVNKNQKMQEVINLIEDKKYGFHTFPVLKRNGKLRGMLTKTDFEFCNDYSKTVGEVMTKNLKTAPKGTGIDEAYELMKKNKKKALPLIDDDGNIAGLYVYSDLKRIKSPLADKYNIDEKGQLRVAAAIGVGDDAFNRLEKILRKNVDVVVIDTAHADSRSVIETLKEIKNKYSIDVVVGNISEPESAKRLVDAGADGIKVGQGPGSICTTRVIAGIGCPQVTAVYNCSKVIYGSGIPVCADGGLRYSGDITIAIGAGAHSVMMGSMLAGIDESPGEIVFFNGRQWKEYRGMGSLAAMESSKGSRERYSQTDAEKLVPEGIEGRIPYKGPLKEVIYQYIGGLRSGMGYVGAANINELIEKADFSIHSSEGQKESHPHDVIITKEASNYSINNEEFKKWKEK